MASLLDQGMDYPQANIAAAATALHRPLTGLEKALIRSLPDSNDPLAMSAVIKSWRYLQVTDDQLQHNCTPTLLVYGTEEFPGMVEYIQQLGTVLPKAELHAISGTNHFDTVLCPEFLQAVKEFLIRRVASVLSDFCCVSRTGPAQDRYVGHSSCLTLSDQSRSVIPRNRSQLLTAQSCRTHDTGRRVPASSNGLKSVLRIG